MRSSGEGGFTLVEVVVALVVLAVATAATTEMLLLAARDGRMADLHERALWEATAVADSLAAMEEVGAGSRSLPGGSVLEWERTADGGWVRLRTPGAERPRVELALIPIGTRATLGARP
ncbi:MAG TPA: prepilin-type N-terminal cleavage/methylation domain-containing protein [Longimicrobiales bacterium]|nr:prepilin-type N-terminal cleavage/methylation domain-containing protein [Longimicrobiales bacterium]